jgi:recombinational DNA repair ATPase RecF
VSNAWRDNGPKHCFFVSAATNTAGVPGSNQTVLPGFRDKNPKGSDSVSNESVVQLVSDGLAASDLSPEAQRLALAAVVGRQALEKALRSPEEPVLVANSGGRDGLLSGFWLHSITAEGFRGIGAATTLPLAPGPGLTLILGRNGSGKSSFAEAAEAAMTGGNERVASKTADWRKAWRNIHDGGQPSVAVDLQVDGESRLLTIRRQWIGKDIAETVPKAMWDDGESYDVAGETWNETLRRYRPFLSYDDLGVVSDKPSTSFDHLIKVLGIDDLTDAHTALSEARTELGKTISAPQEAVAALIRELEAVDDDRSRIALAALGSRPPDVMAVRAALVESPVPSGVSSRAGLTMLAALTAPEESVINDAAERLRAAAKDVEQVKGTDADDARQVADLLDAALKHHGAHGDGPCPVCAQGILDSQWRERSTTQVAALRRRAAESTDARTALKTAMNRARQLVHPVPAQLQQEAPAGIDVAKTLAAWRDWERLATESDAEALATGLAALATPLAEHLTEVREAATERLRQIEDAWRPIAGRVQGWLDIWTAAEQAQPTYETLSAALDWIKKETGRLRDRLMAPFREQSAQIWADLRQDSNVDLGDIAFTGSGATRRKLNVPVRIDGVSGAVPMLSNGELHALGLALFLPRSTAPDSPFRFVIIDDPVQAMDPSKVEGLAKVLHQTAADRQVVVFTHDDRLADAVRRLGLPTTILDVVRRAGSAVETVPNLDPVRRYLDEARQIARTGRLPDDLAAIAVAGSCRDAIEVACQQVARRRLRARGTTISQIDDQLVQAHSTHDRVALALLGNRHRTQQVFPKLNKLAGDSWAGDVLRDVREGAHHSRDDLERIIADSGRLCDLILSIETS